MVTNISAPITLYKAFSIQSSSFILPIQDTKRYTKKVIKISASVPIFEVLYNHKYDKIIDGDISCTQNSVALGFFKYV